MPRALTMERFAERPDDPRLIERLRARRDRFRAAGCNFWVFAREGSAPEVVAFAEAADAAELVAAHADAGEGAPDLYRELELG